MNAREEGFSCIEVLVVLGITLLLMGSTATVGRKMFMEAMVDHEVARIVSDLRWVQERDRTVYYYGSKYSKKAHSNERWNDVWMMMRKDSYSVKGYHISGWTRNCFPGICHEHSSTSNKIYFGGNGNAKNLLTIFVYYTMGGKRYGKYVIIDFVGRIRVDRRPP